MDLLSGLVGAVIGSVIGGVITGGFTYKAALAGAQKAFADQLQLRELDRRARIQGCLNTNVVFDGTFYVSSRAIEAVRLRIIQRRLFVDLQDRPAEDPKVENEIMLRIHTGQGKDIAEMVRAGNTKLTDSVLGTDEVIDLPESEMYGFLADSIKRVIIGTVISISTLDGKVNTERLYLHRFVMGGLDAPDPKGRWHQFFSSIVS
jgi:hypothetical protein